MILLAILEAVAAPVFVIRLANTLPKPSPSAT